MLTASIPGNMTSGLNFPVMLGVKTMQQINHCLVDSTIGFPKNFLLDSDLSGG